ncbi:MAG: hypothetical protein WD070_01845 [Pirellulaceae bacterium]
MQRAMRMKAQVQPPSKPDAHRSHAVSLGRCTKRCWMVAAVCAATVLASPVRGGSGSTVTLPLAGQKVTTGLKLQVNTEWLDGNGYRPVTVSISPLGGGAAPADRTLEITLRPRSRQWGVVMPSVSTSITLEQGQTVAEKTIAIPQFQIWGSLQVAAYEEGRRRDDLSETVGITWSGNPTWSEAAPTILFIDSDASLTGPAAGFINTRPPTNRPRVKQPERIPDIRPLALLHLTDNAGGNLTIAGLDPTEDIDDNGLLRLLQLLHRMEIIHPDRLPSEWLHLTSIDMIFVSLPDLQQLQQSPARWSALRTWLSTGTTLCVYDVGEEFSSLAKLERLLKLAGAGEGGSDTSIDDFLKRGWRSPQAADYADEVRATRGVDWNNPGYGQSQAITTTPRPNGNSARTLKPDRPTPFLIRGVDHGQVVAFSDANPFPGKREDWCWLFNSLNSQDWMWYQRHGLSFHRDNPRYWNLLIPGVGAAPVTSFLVLISLFVIVIGPVNYFMLGRRRKLYLLLLTVPLGAGVVTTALFTYALINDGLGVRVRARSLTRIDQSNGRTVSWSRQSYYAGLAPSTGMSFPSDAAVYPIDHRPTGRYGQPKDLGRHIRWDDEQRLAEGYLNSRSTAQVIVIESRDTSLGIDVSEPASGSTTIRVTNRLGVDIDQLLIRLSDNRSLACGQLPIGESLPLDAIDEKDFPKRWNKLFAAQRPQFPIGFDPNQVENASAIFGNSNRWWQQVDRGLPEPTTATSILERGLRTIGNLKLDAMQPRSYIAIVRQAPNVSLGIESVAEEASFHVVSGTW